MKYLHSLICIYFFLFFSFANGQSVIGKWKFYDAQIDKKYVNVDKDEKSFVEKVTSTAANTKNSLKNSVIEFKNDGSFISQHGKAKYKKEGNKIIVTTAQTEETYIIITMTKDMLTIVLPDMGLPILLLFKKTN